jgi:hypothetical protein
LSQHVGQISVLDYDLFGEEVGMKNHYQAAKASAWPRRNSGSCSAGGKGFGKWSGFLLIPTTILDLRHDLFEAIALGRTVPGLAADIPPYSQNQT